MIKTLQAADIDVVLSLFLSVFTKEPWNDRWESEAYARLYISELLDAPNSLAFGWYEQDMMVGLSLGYAYHWWEGKEYYIKEFCISSTMQGKGLGKLFMHAIEAEIACIGFKHIWLLTERNIPAHGFYENLGFRTHSAAVTMVKQVETN